MIRSSCLKLFLFLFFSNVIVSNCAGHYSETQENIKNFEARELELFPPPKKIEKKKEKKAKKNLKRPYAPPVYLADETLQQENKSEVYASEPLEYTEDLQQDSSNIRKELRPAAPWMNLMIKWAREYVEISRVARDVRLFKLSEKYSKKAIFWMWRVEELRDLDTTEAIGKVQIWLDEIILPDLNQEKPSYFKGADAYEKIYQVRENFSVYEDRLCAVSDNVRMVESLARLEFAIDLLSLKLYDRSYQEASNAYSILGARPNKDIECLDIDRDRINFPFDLCPWSPEDRDGVEDEDGCPDFEN